MKHRVTALLLALCLLAALCLPALAEEATATSLRLNSTEGTVTLKNQNGRTLTVREDIKLYSGYTITTGEASYAYISLDDTKAVKLDASSSVEIKKSGKQLEVLLSSGDLFFNVTAPLKSDETLNIRTSTMVTGIRGTAGVVDLVGENQTMLYLLDGKVTVKTLDAGGVQTREVTAGSTATATRSTLPSGQDQLQVVVTDFSAQQLPGFAAVEVARDPALQEKIRQETTLDVPKLIQEAPEKLAQDQADKRARIEQAAAQAPQLPQDKVTAPPAASETPDRNDREDRDDQGNNTPPPPVTTPPPIPTPPPNETLLTEAVTEAQISEALGRAPATVRVTTDEPISIPGTLTIPVGKTLELENTALTVESTGTLEVLGILSVNGRSEIVNQGTLSVGGVGIRGSLVLDQSAQLNNLATVTINAFAQVTNLGTITHSAGTWTNHGQITSTEGGRFHCNSSNAFAQLGGVVRSESGYALEGSGSVEITGGLFLSTAQSAVVSGVTVTGTHLRGEGSAAGMVGSLYLLGSSLQSLLGYQAFSTLTVHLPEAYTSTEALTIGENLDVTLAFPAGGGGPVVLSVTDSLTINGSLTLIGNGALSFEGRGTLTFVDDGEISLGTEPQFPIHGAARAFCTNSDEDLAELGYEITNPAPGDKFYLTAIPPVTGP